MATKIILNNAKLKKILNFIRAVVDDESGATHGYMKIEEGYLTIEDNTPSGEDERYIDVIFTTEIDYLGYNFGECIYDFGTIYGTSREDDIEEIMKNIEQYFNQRGVRPFF